jgi:hypothetical protein
MRPLSFRCGERFVCEWTNVDLSSHSRSVLQHDLSEGIPFVDNSFDLV